MNARSIAAAQCMVYSVYCFGLRRLCLLCCVAPINASSPPAGRTCDCICLGAYGDDGDACFVIASVAGEAPTCSLHFSGHLCIAFVDGEARRVCCGRRASAPAA